MKNLLFFLLAAMIMVSCNSCEPDDLPKPPPPPPVEVKVYTVTATCIGTGGKVDDNRGFVKSGDKIVVRFAVMYGYEIDVMKDNGVVVTSYVTNYHMPNAKDYTITNVTANHTIEVTFKLMVNGKLDYLTRAPWYECYILSLLPDGTWGQWTKWDLITKQIFYLDGRRETYWDGRLVGNGTYTLTPTTLTIAEVFKIVKLDADSLIYTVTGQNPDGNWGTAKLFYSHVEN